MAEHEGGDSKFMTGFLLGFLVGVLICLGAGGALFVVRGRDESLRAREAMMEAEAARREAEVVLARTEQERQKAEQKLKEATQKKEKEEAEARGKDAWVGVKRLEQAAVAYKLATMEYPQTLKILTESQNGKVAYVEADKLIDPWGRPYVYERQTVSPKTGAPLIYSRGANPGKSPPIRNWEADAKDKGGE
jgi:hypothetical protein